MGIQGETPDTGKDAPRDHRATSRPYQTKITYFIIPTRNYHVALRSARDEATHSNSRYSLIILSIWDTSIDGL